MIKVKEIIKENIISLTITAFSIVIILLLQVLGIFYSLELKALDYAFGIRGPTTGVLGHFNEKVDSTDIVIVDLDDESYRLIPWTYPFPRGEVWSKVVEHLSIAGAKVIVLDIMFDAFDQNSEILVNYGLELGTDLPQHGDKIFSKAISDAKKRGTDVILASKIAYEPTAIPPEHIVFPNPIIMESNPFTGLTNVIEDKDGFMRRYYVFLPLKHEKNKLYMTLGMQAVHSYLDLSPNIYPTGNPNNQIITYGPLNVSTYGETPTFLINYYGPPSSGVIPNENITWKTFPRYPLANIIDVSSITLSDELEDTDWMDQFIGGVPEWISLLPDSKKRKETMKLLGITDFDVTKTPFYNKIVIIGSSIETHHDAKKTPYYNYGGNSQLTPGMETVANAMQTVIDNNYITIYGGSFDLTKNSFWPHFLLISSLAIIVMILFSINKFYITIIGILLEIIVFISIAIGCFVNDFLWLIKKIMYILPNSILNSFGDWIFIKTPAYGQSIMIPIIAPLAVIALTYGGNVFYKFITEQKDKLYLKKTFGTYISPTLIDQMFKQKKKPTLGGKQGIHTALFTDIQDFSIFSEKLSPEKLVELLNEYLTAMTDVLLHNKGTLDKYWGDAIIAFFGAPVPLKNQEYLACLTCCQMNQKLEFLRKKWAREGDKWPNFVHNMRHRIGVNSGPLVTGNMGSEMRMNYTMMGDAVNLTSRLESSCKHYGVEVQVGEKIYEATKDRMTFRLLDYVIVKGRSSPEKTYELISQKGNEPKLFHKLLPYWNDAMQLYQEQKWDMAITLFKKCDNFEEDYIGRLTTPSRIYILRCEKFKLDSPGSNWDGSWTLTEK
tara:strand:+ start:140 stop:2641 length:2502 start_codon:yes stop_codon:yes gene_type:complete